MKQEKFQMITKINSLLDSPRSYLFLPIFYLAMICLFEFSLHPTGILNSTICPAYAPISLFSTTDEIIRCYGGMDIASYIRSVPLIEKHGLETFSSMGRATWPPGFSYLEMLLLNIGDVPLPVALFSIGTVLWAFAFYQIFSLVKQLTGIFPVHAALTPLLLLAVPFVSGFYLWGGILMSEPIATALFMIVVLDLWRQVATQSKITIVRAALLGMLLAIAVYIRAQFDLIFHALMVLSLLLIMAGLIFKRNVPSNLVLSLVVIVVVFQGLVLPYKAYMASHGHGMAMANVSYVFGNLWKKESWLIANGAGFFTGGGGHSMCAVDAATCQAFEERIARGETIRPDEYKKAAFNVALSQPLALLSFKWPYFWENWKRNNIGSGEDTDWSRGFNAVLFLAIFVTAIGRCIQNRKQGLIETAYFLAFAAGATVFCFIVHFEARYLLPVKLLGVVWAIVFATSLLSQFLGNKEARSCR